MHDIISGVLFFYSKFANNIFYRYFVVVVVIIFVAVVECRLKTMLPFATSKGNQKKKQTRFFGMNVMHPYYFLLNRPKITVSVPIV